LNTYCVGYDAQLHTESIIATIKLKQQNTLKESNSDHHLT